MNIFKEMFCAIFKPKEYMQFLKNRNGKVFGYGILLILIYFIITIIVPLIRFQISTGGIGAIVYDFVPDFKLENGKMWVERPIEYDKDGMCVYIDTSEGSYFLDADEMEDKLKGYSQAIIMDSEKIIAKNNGEVNSLKFEDISDANFSRDDIMGYMPALNVVIVAVTIIIYIVENAMFFFGALFVALIGMIVISCTKTKLAFGQLYILSIYARTLPIFIKAILGLFSVVVPFFMIINFGISIAYLVIACTKNKKEEKDISEQNMYTSADV